MTALCKDCSRPLPTHGPECPAQEYPSLATEYKEPQPPIEFYRAKRKVEAWVRGEKK